MKYIWILGCFLGQSIYAQAQELLVQSIGDYSIQLQEKSCQWQLINHQKESLLQDENIVKMYFVAPNLLYVQNGFMPKYYFLLEQKWQPLDYEKVELIDNKYLLVNSAKKQGLISTQGEGLLPLQYNAILPLQKYFLIKKATDWFLWDSDTRKIVFSFPNAPWFLDIFEKGSMANFLYFATGETQFARLNLSNLSVERIELSFVQYMTQGLWANRAKNNDNIQLKSIDAAHWIIEKNGKFGIVDENRTLIFDTQYNNILMDENYPNLLHIQEGGNWGVYSIVKKAWLIPIDNKQQVPFFVLNENTIAKKEKNNFLIISSAQEKLSLKADVYKVLNAKYLAFSLGNFWGIYDLDAQEIIIPAQYKSIALLQNDLFKVMNAENTSFIVNLSNKKIACWK